MSRQANLVLSAEVLDLYAVPETSEAILELRVDDGHEWHVVLNPGSLHRLYQGILREHAEQRTKFPLRLETR